ncbi:hypothetical protein VT84_16465 [Gemmata sp. SH-PL17]|uniref:hypothetical protein n=1 Tax=Gemmata sp. SH-PL17 TaxID=1630693 RepID=UPI00078C3F47|nr:hypothetical protein [Gemmata sp. SH-PL17]AMV25994.1 hypothetical protein VT84_16465 [Gemmata sp. SH-PL17]
MNAAPEQTALDAYRAELLLLTEAMSVTTEEAPQADVDSQLQLDVFARENFDKRIDKVKAQIEFIQEAFDDLPELLRVFSLEHPMALYDRQNSDGAAFLDWLTDRHQLTGAQKDSVTVARSRIRIEEIAAVERAEHVRFQELLGAAEELLPELETNIDLQLHLNPIRVRARLLTDTFLEGEKPPVDVVFFARDEDVRTAVLGATGLELLEELARFAPCTFGVWVLLSDIAEREELIRFAQQLVELGLLALE